MKGRGAAERLRSHTCVAELFYLRHLRSCAATASGSHGASLSASKSLCTRGLRLLLACVTELVIQALSCCFSVLLAILGVLTAVWRYILRLVLQSTASVLEIVACIVLVDNNRLTDQWNHKVLAACILLLALMDWHVPMVNELQYMLKLVLQSTWIAMAYTLELVLVLQSTPRTKDSPPAPGWAANETIGPIVSRIGHNFQMSSEFIGLLSLSQNGDGVYESWRVIKPTPRGRPPSRPPCQKRFTHVLEREISMWAN